MEATNIPPPPRGIDVVTYRKRFHVGDESWIQGMAARLEDHVRRPWTVERLAAAYAATLNAQRRAALVYLLAASRDPMGLRVAGNALMDNDADVAIAAAEGIELYWMTVKAGAGGTEQVLDGVRAWWEDRRVAFRREEDAARTR